MAQAPPAEQDNDSAGKGGSPAAGGDYSGPDKIIVSEQAKIIYNNKGQRPSNTYAGSGGGRKRGSSRPKKGTTPALKNAVKAAGGNTLGSGSGGTDGGAPHMAPSGESQYDDSNAADDSQAPVPPKAGDAAAGDGDNSGKGAAGGGEDEDGHAKSIKPGDLTKAEAAGAAAMAESNAEAAEKSAIDKQIGPGYTDDSKKGDGKQGKGARAKRHRTFLIGGGATAGIVAFIIFAFSALAPLKIVSLVETLQDRYFGGNESAVTRRSQTLFDNYIKKHIMPNLRGTCTSTKTADKGCFAVAAGATPASRLYHAWSDARLENKLANNYGIEFSRAPAGGDFTLKIRGIPDTTLSAGFSATAQSIEDAVTEKHGGTKEFRQHYRATFNNAMKGETRLTRVYYRFKVGKLLEAKYGVRRCVFACNLRDDFSDWKTNKKTAAKLWLLRRVVEPHNDLAAKALSCIVSGGCTDVPSRTDASNGLPGERQDKLEKDIRKYLDARGAQYTEDTIADLVKLVPKLTTIIDKGLTTYLISTVVEKLIDQQAAESAEKAIPIVGQIDMVANMIRALSELAPKMRRWGYGIATTAYITTYMMTRSGTDELKSGNVDPELVGSLVGLLGDEAGDAAHQGQSAEVSPLYQEVINSPTSQVSLLDILSPSVSAAPGDPIAAPKRYTCDDNSPPSGGNLICPEESVLTNNWATQISDSLNEPPLNALSTLADWWHDNVDYVLGSIKDLIAVFTGTATEAASQILDLFPPTAAAKAFLESQASKVFGLFMEWMFPSPVSPSPSGARFLNANIAGAAALASSAGANVLGGRVLTAVEAADLSNDQNDIYRQEFAAKPLMYRLFNTDSARSLTSQVALSIPTSTGLGVQSSFASLITNPFGKILHGLSSFFAKPKIYAAPGVNPFGIPTMGYALNDPLLDMDPDLLTDSYCKTINDLWITNDVTINPITGDHTETPLPDAGDPDIGIDVHHKANPCMLEDATVGSSGGYFDSSLVTTAPTPPPAATPPAPAPTPPPAVVACADGAWTCVAEAPAGPYGERTFPVPAAQNWVNTGLYLRTGQTATITVAGTWHVTDTDGAAIGNSVLTDTTCKLGSFAVRIGLNYNDPAVTCMNGTRTYTASKDGIVFVGGIASSDLGESYGTRLKATGSKTVTINSQGDTVPTILASNILSFPFDSVTSGWVEVQGAHSIITLPVATAKKDAATLVAALNRIDTIYNTHAELQPALPPFFGQRIRWFPDASITGIGWMTAGNPIRMDFALVNGTDQQRISRAGEVGTETWGFAHELGHTFSFAHGFSQYQPLSIEVWANVFTMYTNERLGLPGNVAFDGSCSQGALPGTYVLTKGFINTATTTPDPFTGLCFLMQFQYKYGWDFYKKFFAALNLDRTLSATLDPERGGWDYVYKKFTAAAGESVAPIFDQWKVPHQ